MNASVRLRVNSLAQMVELLGIRWPDVCLLAGLGLLYGIFEGVGISLLLPLLEFVEKGPGAEGHEPLSRLGLLAREISARWSASSVLPILLGLVFLAVAAKQVVRYFYQAYAAKVRFEALAKKRQEGVAAFLQTRVPFVVTVGHGRLVSALTTELQGGADAAAYFLQVFESAILLAVYLFLLIALAVWVTPLVIVVMGLLGLAMQLRLQRSKQFGQQIAAANQELHRLIAEKFSGIRLVKMTGQERQEGSRISEAIARMAQTFRRIARAKVGMEVLLEPMIMLFAFMTVHMAITVFGMSLASLGMFMFILLRSVPVLRQFNDARQGITVSLEGLRQVQALVDHAQTSHEDLSGSREFSGLREAIVFEHVGFAYGAREEHWVLRDVSCRIPKGSLTAIVGRSGVGKSTLLDLLPRLQHYSIGHIIIDGIALREFNVQSLRAAIGMIDQYGFLFDDTVAANISYGLRSVAQERIVKAAQAAYAHEFIAQLPQGYQTQIGERGVRLSSGQRQRLGLARVFLQNPDILLLDEPTSALDSESERFIHLALDQLRRTKTIVIVAHRLSTVRGADQILVLEDGRIAERGDHLTLLKEGPLYRELFGRQLMEVETYA